MKPISAGASSPRRSPAAFHPGEAVTWLRRHLPDDAILCNGAGNYATWVHRFHRFTKFATQLAPTSGSMGYGVPAAIGAKRLFPERTVVAFAGDGCFLMNGQDFATAVQYELPVIVVVVDNGMYGTIRMHQEKHYPGRVSATTLKNPDFAAYAKAFGGHGERVETTAEFGAGLRACGRVAASRRSCTASSIRRRSRRRSRSRRSGRRRWRRRADQRAGAEPQRPNHIRRRGCRARPD